MHSFPLLKIFRRLSLKRNTLQFNKLPNIKYRNPKLKIQHFAVNQPLMLQRAIAELGGMDEEGRRKGREVDEARNRMGRKGQGVG